ncbi:MAG: HAD family hydrolase [Egibacteraceae bacterium]
MERHPDGSSADARLILWDVDHTLIAPRGVGREIYASAFARVFGRPMQQQGTWSGRTETDIFRDTARLHGIEPSREHMERFFDELAKGYVDRSAALMQRGQAMPGAADALSALAQLPGVVQTVLTGNIRPVAVTKLATFGLADHIDFDVGAYGSDSSDRGVLVTLARDRAESAYGKSFLPETTVLIGDTPNDVRAGVRGGVRVVAVASGRSSPDELRAAGADVVLPDLTDLELLLRHIQG